jgi:hypothetical protein
MDITLMGNLACIDLAQNGIETAIDNIGTLTRWEGITDRRKKMLETLRGLRVMIKDERNDLEESKPC